MAHLKKLVCCLSVAGLLAGYLSTRLSEAVIASSGKIRTGFQATEPLDNSLVNQTFHQPTVRIAAVGKANDALQERQSGLQPVNFNRDIRPILSDNCFACHGPDEKQRQARLRFDMREGAFAKTGVIVPGDASKSKLIQRVSATDPATLAAIAGVAAFTALLAGLIPAIRAMRVDPSVALRAE